MKKLFTLSLVLLSTSPIFAAAPFRRFVTQANIFAARKLQTTAPALGKKTQPVALQVSLKGARKALKKEIGQEVEEGINTLRKTTNEGTKVLKEAEKQLEKKLKDCKDAAEIHSIELNNHELTRISEVGDMLIQNATVKIEQAVLVAIKKFETAVKRKTRTQSRNNRK